MTTAIKLGYAGAGVTILALLGIGGAITWFGGIVLLGAAVGYGMAVE